MVLDFGTRPFCLVYPPEKTLICLLLKEFDVRTKTDIDKVNEFMLAWKGKTKSFVSLKSQIGKRFSQRRGSITRVSNFSFNCYCSNFW